MKMTLDGVVYEGTPDEIVAIKALLDAKKTQKTPDYVPGTTPYMPPFTIGDPPRWWETTFTCR